MTGQHTADGRAADGRAADSAADGPSDDQAADVDHEAAIERMCERAESVRERELSTAVGKLEEQGDLTDAQRAALARLSRRITDELVGAPAAQLRAAATEGEHDSVRAALGLFGADETDAPGEE